jgi:hypothetical protein
MGGGNAQKSAAAAAKNRAKAESIKSPEERKASAAKAEKDKNAFMCAICRQVRTHAGSDAP